jgi:hypothetical protein
MKVQVDLPPNPRKVVLKTPVALSRQARFRPYWDIPGRPLSVQWRPVLFLLFHAAAGQEQNARMSPASPALLRCVTVRAVTGDQRSCTTSMSGTSRSARIWT